MGRYSMHSFEQDNLIYNRLRIVLKIKATTQTEMTKAKRLEIFPFFQNRLMNMIPFDEACYKL